MLEYIEHGRSADRQPGGETVPFSEVRLHAPIARPREDHRHRPQLRGPRRGDGCRHTGEAHSLRQVPEHRDRARRAHRHPPDHRAGRLRGGARRRSSAARPATSRSPRPSTTSTATRTSTTSPPATCSSARAGSGRAARPSTPSARSGPTSSTRDEIPDPQALSIRCTLNGEVMQDGTTDKMIFSVAELVAFLSTGMTLMPGDVIITGTPAGRRRRPRPAALPEARRRGDRSRSRASAP